jgi:hypothetical protein
VTLIGDRERERAVALLHGHYLQGRLSLEELTERLEVALGAQRDGEVRRALAELPSVWRAPAGLAALGRAAARGAFVVAVWLLWWLTSLVLFVGFVVSVVAGGLSLTNVLVFAALWLACTVAAWRVARRRRAVRR